MGEGHARVGGQPPFHETMQAIEDLLRLLTWNETERELGCGSCGNDRFGAGPTIAANDTVDLCRRARPQLLEHAEALLASRLAQADRAEKARGIESEPTPDRKLGGGRIAYAIVETGDGDAALLVMQRSEDLGKHAQGVQSRSAIETGMQVS